MDPQLVPGKRTGISCGNRDLRRKRFFRRGSSLCAGTGQGEGIRQAAKNIKSAGVQKDIEVARHLVQYLGIQSAEVNIHAGVEAVKASIAEGMSGASFNTQSLTNIPPRIRMTTLYAVSQTMNGRVSNNCNRSENYVGYSTIFGDAAGDFSPLANLTVAEVKEVGRALGLPNEFVDKAPADGLSDKTDEDAFGFTYEQMDTLILTGFCDDDVIREKIERRHAANLFKLRPMPEFNPENGKE